MPARTSVFLNVTDIERSLAFYKALGFKVASSTRGRDGRVAYADLDLDGAELGLGAIPTNEDAEFRAWVGTPLGAGVVVYVTLPRGGVDRVFGKARSAGAVVEMEPTDRAYGRVATINDPDGYVLTLHEDPAKPATRPAKKPRTSKTASPRKAATRKGAAKAGAKKAKRSRARR